MCLPKVTRARRCQDSKLMSDATAAFLRPCFRGDSCLGTSVKGQNHPQLPQRLLWLRRQAGDPGWKGGPRAPSNRRRRGWHKVFT